MLWREREFREKSPDSVQGGLLIPSYIFERIVKRRWVEDHCRSAGNYTDIGKQSGGPTQRGVGTHWKVPPLIKQDP